MEMPDTREGRVEKVREVLEDGDYQSRLSALSKLPDAGPAEGGDPEITDRLEEWLEENANGEAPGAGELEAVDTEVDDAGGAAEPEVEDADDKTEEAKRRTRVVRRIQEKERELYIDLAEQLYHISEDNLYYHVDNPTTGQPYNSMKEYVERETAHSSRKATYLMLVWEYYVVRHSQDFLDRVKHLGWTKLRVLASEEAITPENADEWIDWCEDHSRRELEEELSDDESGEAAEEPGGPDGDTSQTNREVFELTDDQLPPVSDAIEIGMELGDTDNKSEALSLVCSEFVSMHTEALDGDRSLAEHLERIERNLGGYIVFFDEDAGRYALRYGRDVLEQVAEQKRQGGDEGE